MIKRVLTTAMVCLIAAAWPWTSAMAAVAPYKIVVKDSVNNKISDDAQSGLSFADSDTSADGCIHTPESAPAPKIVITSGLPSVLLPFTFDTVETMKVCVYTTKLNKPDTDPGCPGVTCTDLEQGANVEGLKLRMTGTKLVGTTLVKLAIDFDTVGPTGTTQPLFTRTHTIKRVFPSGSETLIASGFHHIWNPLSLKKDPVTGQIPEPGTLGLLGIGLGALAIRARRRLTR